MRSMLSPTSRQGLGDGFSGEARMTNAFFWYTGLVFWILVTAATVSLLAADGLGG